MIQVWLQDRERERRSLPEKSLSKMHRALTARPKWDSKLILPKLAFPNKYAAYTVSTYSMIGIILTPIIFLIITTALSRSNTYRTKCLLGTSRELC